MIKLLSTLIYALKIKYRPAWLECNFHKCKVSTGERLVYINVFNALGLTYPLCVLGGRPTSSHFTEAHEVGHALFDEFNMLKNPVAQQLFGDFTIPYHKEFGLVSSIFHRKSKDHPTKYAAVHPREDFADCVATLIMANGQVPKSHSVRLTTKYYFVKYYIVVKAREVGYDIVF